MKSLFEKIAAGLLLLPLLVWATGSSVTTNPALYTNALRADLASSATGKGAALIGYMPSGASGVAATIDVKLKQFVSAFDFLTSAQITDVVNNTASIDITGPIQAALNYGASSGHPVYFPAGTYLGNWTVASDTSIVGDGQNKTIFKPAINAPVFGVSEAVSTVRLRFERFGIAGNPAWGNQHGIALKPVAVSTFVDTVSIDSVWILNCGKNGLYTYGTSSGGPFVQNLRINHVFISGSVQEGLYMDGEAFESVFTDFWVYNNGSNVIPNATIGSKTNATHAPSRVTWIGGGLSQTAVAGTPRYVSDLNTTAASAVVTSATASFTAGDVGKYVAVHNGNTYAHPLITTISGVTNSTTATLAENVAVTNTPTKAIINLGIGGAINVQYAKQVKLIGLDVENTGVFVVMSGNLQQNLSIDNCNFAGNYPALAMVWAQGGGDGLDVKNNNTSNTSILFYNLLSSTSNGAILALASQLKNVNFKQSANPPFLAHIVMFDYQNVAANMIIYHRDIEFIRMNGTGTVNKLLDLSSGVSSLMRGQRMVLYAGGATTINHYTTASGNIYTKTGANVSLSAGQSISLQWDDVTALWFER